MYHQWRRKKQGVPASRNRKLKKKQNQLKKWKSKKVDLLPQHLRKNLREELRRKSNKELSRKASPNKKPNKNNKANKKIIMRNKNKNQVEDHRLRKTTKKKKINKNLNLLLHKKQKLTKKMEALQKIKSKRS